MRRAPDEFTAPGIGLLQWLALTPWDRTHWYIGEDQRFYRVAMSTGGYPGSLSDIDGNLIRHIVTPAPPADQEVLV